MARALSASLRERIIVRYMVVLALAIVPLRCAADDWIYTFRAGDNLWNLTARHLTNMRYVAALQGLNGVTDPYHIPPGTEIRIPLAWAHQRVADVEVIAARNDVAIRRQGAATTTAAHAGIRLRVGDEIRCGKNAFATLQFGDGSRLRLQPNSHIRLKNLQVYGRDGLFESVVDLQEGETETIVSPRNDVDSRFEISTPAAVSSVRGTTFRAGHDTASDSAQSEVLQGAIAVTGAAQSVWVPAGFGTSTRRGSSPAPPRALLSAPDLSHLPKHIDTVHVQFTIAAVAGAAAYRAQIANDAAFSDPMAEVKSPQPTLSGFELGDGDYWLRVRALDELGIEGHDAVHAFTLDARPEPPIVIAPQAGTVVTDSPIVMKWVRHTSADRYVISVAADPDFTNMILAETTTTETMLALEESIPPGQYYWRIRAVSDSEGRGPPSTALPFEVSLAAPSAATPLASEEEVVFSWSPVPGAAHYHLLVARDEAFTDIVTDETLSETHYTFAMPTSGRYFLRVRAVRSDGVAGPFGATHIAEVPVASRPPYWLLAVPLLLLL